MVLDFKRTQSSIFGEFFKDRHSWDREERRAHLPRLGAEGRSRGSDTARAASPAAISTESVAAGRQGGYKGSHTVSELHLAVTRATHFSCLHSRHGPGTAENDPSRL